MKLTKRNLIRLTKSDLTKLGYQEIPDTITGAQGLYIKYVNGDLYLTLGLTISRYYDYKFTGSYYLSMVPAWACFGGDIPRRSYQRVGKLLTAFERQTLLDESHQQEGTVDSWWDLEDEDAISNFIETVEITEQRFLEQPGLTEEIRQSKDVCEQWKLSRSVLELFKISGLNQGAYNFIPSKNIDGIPLDWFKAAEIVIINSGAILNLNTVKQLAASAYRMQSIS